MGGAYLPQSEYDKLKTMYPNRLPTREDVEWYRRVQQEGNIFERGLELLGRPLSGISSGIAAGLRGEDILAGAWSGLSGQSPIRGMGDVLAQQQVPEFGRYEFGPLSFTGRDVLGLAGDIAFDPLTYVGGALGKGAMLAGKAGMPTAAKALSTAQDIYNLGPVTRQAEQLVARFPEYIRSHVRSIEPVSRLEDVSWIHSRGALLVDPTRRELPADVAHELGHAVIGRDPTTGLYKDWVEFRKTLGDTSHPTQMHHSFADVFETWTLAPETLPAEVQQFMAKHVGDIRGLLAKRSTDVYELRPLTEWIGQVTKPSVQRAIANLPGIKLGAGLVSPAKVAEGADAITIARGAAIRDVQQRIVPMQAAPFETSLPQRLKQRFVDKGQTKVRLDDGSVIGVREFAENPTKYGASPEEIEYLNRYSQFRQALHQYGREQGVDFKDLVRSKPEDEGWQYAGMFTRGKKEVVPLYRRKLVGLEQPHQKARKYQTQLEGEEAGWEYLGLIDSLKADIRNVYSAVIDKQYREALMPYAEVRDIGKAGLLKESIKELSGQYRQAKGEAQRAEYLLGKAGSPMAEREAAYEAAYQKYDELTQQLADVEQQLYEKEVTLQTKREPLGIKRPKGLFVGWTDEEVLDFAQREGRNPYQDDWWDKLDPVALKDARESLRGGGKTRAIQQLRAETTPLRIQRRKLLAEVKAAETEMKHALEALGYPDTGELQVTLGTARGQMEQLGSEISGMRQQRREALHPGLKGYVSTGQPALKDMFFRPEVAAAINKRLEAQPNPLFKKVNDIGQIGRLMMTGWDFGGGMIQGLPTLFMNPKAWAQAQHVAFRSLLNPEYYRKFLASERVQRVLREVPGLIVGQPEPFEAVAKGGPLQFLGGVMERPAAAFDAFGTAAKVYMAEGLLDTYKRLGMVDELGDFLNKMTGVTDTAAIGVMPTQRAVEAGLIAFAPRYLRASLGLVADALFGGGDLKSWQTRQALASMLVGGMAMYLKLAHMAGQEPVLDPSDSRFMTLQVGTDRVGIGSIWTSLGRLLARSIENPDSLTKLNREELDQNPMLRWLRSRTPPVASAALDILSGKTYVGEALDTPEAYAKWAVSQVMPFTLESHLLQEPRADIASLPFELSGFRTFPQTFGDQRERIAREMFGRKYEELSGFEQEDVTQRAKSLGLPIRGEEAIRRNEIFTEHNQELEKLAQEVQQGAITKSQYREARGRIKERLSVRLADLEAARTPDEQRRRAEAKAKLPDREQARERYYEILRQEDPLGRPSWEAAEDYLASLPEEWQTYIDEVGEARLANLPPAARQLETEYRQARKTLKPYWEVREEVLKRRGLLETWRQATPAEQAALEQTAKFKAATREVDQRRQVMRRRNREIDEALQEWYGYQAVNRVVQSAGIPNLPEIPSFTLPKKATNPLARFALPL